MGRLPWPPRPLPRSHGRPAVPRHPGRGAAARRMRWSRPTSLHGTGPEQQCSLLRVVIRSLNAKPDISVIRNAAGNVLVLDQAECLCGPLKVIPPTSDLFHRRLCGHSAQLGRVVPARASPGRLPWPASPAALALATRPAELLGRVAGGRRARPARAVVVIRPVGRPGQPPPGRCPRRPPPHRRSGPYAAPGCRPGSTG